MGLTLIAGANSGCAHDTPARGVRIEPPNPDPARFTVIHELELGGCVTILEVQYHGCTNFEGRKILVLHRPLAVVRQAARIDPHFCEVDHLGLVARFRPDDVGRSLARELAEILAGGRR